MERREILGNVVFTSTNAVFSNSAMSVTAVDASTFPDGSSGNPFVIIVDRGTPLEEKILCSSRSGNTFTILQRGYDGTPVENHSNGSKIDHVLDAVVIQDMNTTTYDNEILFWMEAN